MTNKCIFRYGVYTGIALLFIYANVLLYKDIRLDPPDICVDVIEYTDESVTTKHGGYIQHYAVVRNGNQKKLIAVDINTAYNKYPRICVPDTEHVSSVWFFFLLVIDVVIAFVSAICCVIIFFQWLMED